MRCGHSHLLRERLYAPRIFAHPYLILAITAAFPSSASAIFATSFVNILYKSDLVDLLVTYFLMLDTA